jgi:hypothetical protein
MLLVATLVCGLGSAAGGAAEERPIDAKLSTITVRVSASGPAGAFPRDHVIQAPLLEGSLDAAIPHMQLAIDARRLRVVDPGLSARDRQSVKTRMLGADVLDVTQFPFISFHSVTIDRLESSRWRIHGELGLHGQIHDRIVDVSSANGHYKGSTTVRLSEFGIAPVSILGGTVTVKDEVTVEFDVVMSTVMSGRPAAAGANSKSSSTGRAGP